MKINKGSSKIRRYTLYFGIVLSVIAFFFYVLAWSGDPSNIIVLVRGLAQTATIILFAVSMLVQQSNERLYKFLFVGSCISLGIFAILLFV